MLNEVGHQSTERGHPVRVDGQIVKVRRRRSGREGREPLLQIDPAPLDIQLRIAAPRSPRRGERSTRIEADRGVLLAQKYISEDAYAVEDDLQFARDGRRRSRRVDNAALG